MNNAAVNIHVQVFACTYFSVILGLFLGVESLDHIVTLCLII